MILMAHTILEISHYVKYSFEFEIGAFFVILSEHTSNVYFLHRLFSFCIDGECLLTYTLCMIENIFEQIKKVNEYGSEYWSARELCKLLGYTEYGKFVPAIERAKDACSASQQAVNLHFAHVSEPQKSRNQYGETQGQTLEDYSLSRYACYLIAQNGDSRKEEIALAQTYFAIQTRRQEMQDQLAEDGKRVFLREEMKEHNKNLAKAAKKAGVVHYATFQDYGYIGLYGGLRNRDIHARKKLEKAESILDHMGSEELAANLFRTTQTEAKLRREGVVGENQANRAHHTVGKKVRQTIQELGGTMPEKLPTPEHLKEAKKRLKKCGTSLGGNSDMEPDPFLKL